MWTWAAAQGELHHSSFPTFARRGCLRFHAGTFCANDLRGDRWRLTNNEQSAVKGKQYE